MDARSPIIKLAPVTRAGMRLLISLYGMSETGKTLSALLLASGIEPDPAKRALLDTEGGERGRAYVDQIDGGYLYAALTPPFTPERYIQALEDIAEHGVLVLVIDSVSHAWFAEGGILDIIENATEKNDLAKWAKPKRRLGKMTRRMMSADMHIILCSRAKQPLVEVEGANGRKTYAPGPIVPIQEKTLRYDMTVMAHMLGDGRFSVDRKDGGKCPGALRPVFAGHDTMTAETGRQLAAWVQSEGGKSPEHRRLERDAMTAAEGGTVAFRAFWKDLSKEQRAVIVNDLGNLKSVSESADEDAERLKTERQRTATDAASNLDDPFSDATEPGESVVVEALRPNANPFWSEPSYELSPNPDGKGRDWPAWEARMLELAATAPSDDCRLKLREDNRKQIENFRAAQPMKVEGIIIALATLVTA